MQRIISGFLHTTAKVFWMHREYAKCPAIFVQLPSGFSFANAKRIFQVFFPGHQLLHAEPSHNDIDVRILNLLASKTPFLVLCEHPSVFHSGVVTQKQEASVVRLQLGMQISKHAAADILAKRDYKAESHQVVVPKSYAMLSGAMIEVFPEDATCPYGIEFYGDEIVAMYKKGEDGIQKVDALPFFAYEGDRKGTLESFLNRHDITFVSFELMKAASPHMVLNTLPTGKPGEQNLDMHTPLLFDDKDHRNHELKQAMDSGYELHIATAYKEYLLQDMPKKTGESLVLHAAHIKDPIKSFVWEDSKCMVLTDSELWFGDSSQSGGSSGDFVQALREGDYVVHIEHGIARFTQMKQVDIKGIVAEYMELEFADGATIFVPVSQADRVAKYAYVPGRPPKLSYLGSKTWQETVQKAKTETRKVAQDLLDLYAKRSLEKKPAFSEHTEFLQDFVHDFAYEDTKDQEKAWEEIQTDLEKETPMDRILCGDVGFGKTEIAMRACMQTVLSGHQVLVLAPTTVLAKQHLRSFLSRFAGYPVRVEYLGRGVSKERQRRVLHDFENGDVHIIIGTHRLLSSDIKAQSLGLLVIDEEQRFGVTQKERIKNAYKHVSILSLSATPIPRTLHLWMSGVREISVLGTPPQGRMPIKTQVRQYSSYAAVQAIQKEMDRGGQVYVIFNRVRGMEMFKKELVAHLHKNDAKIPRVVTLHGQMPEEEIETRLQDFQEHSYDVLISSTIIENGIDMPNVNSILVLHAERFGLSELHQLRGRVGRSSTQGYAYFFYHKENPGEEAEARLQAILRYQNLGDGFSIAAADLDIRGAGTILWEKQHGTVDAVGITHYMTMLRHEVEKLKKGGVSDADDVQIDIPVSGYIPDSYVSEASEKIRIYQSISGACNTKDLRHSIAKIEDKHGPVPQTFSPLVQIAHLRFLAKDAGVQTIKTVSDPLSGKFVRLYPDKERIKSDRIPLLVQKYPDIRIKLSYLQLPIKTLGDDIFVGIRAVLEKLL